MAFGLALTAALLGCEGGAAQRGPREEPAPPAAETAREAPAAACPRETAVTIVHEGRGLSLAPIAPRTVLVTRDAAAREVLWIADFPLDPAAPLAAFPEEGTALRVELFHEDGSPIAPGVFRQEPGIGAYHGVNVLRRDVNLLMANEAGTVELTVVDAIRICGRLSLFDGSLRVEGELVAPRAAPP